MFGFQPSIPHDVPFEVVVCWYHLVITQKPVKLVILKQCRLGGWRSESPLFGLDVHLRLQSPIPHDVSFKSYRLLA